MILKYNKLKSLLLTTLFIMISVLFLSCSSNQYSEQLVPDASDDVTVFTIELLNGQTSIEPMKFHLSAYRPVTEEDEFNLPDGGEDSINVVFTDGAGMYDYDMVTNINEIPTIDKSGPLILSRGYSTSIIGIDIYDSNAALIHNNLSSWIDLPTLADGQYFIVISIHNEINDYYENAKFLFVLNI